MKYVSVQVVIKLIRRQPSHVVQGLVVIVPEPVFLGLLLRKSANDKPLGWRVGRYGLEFSLVSFFISIVRRYQPIDHIRALVKWCECLVWRILEVLRKDELDQLLLDSESYMPHPWGFPVEQ